MADNRAFGGYGLGDPRTTARLNRLVEEMTPEEREQRQREINDAIYVEAVRNFFLRTEPDR